jgi:acyl-CoA-binding protein
MNLDEQFQAAVQQVNQLPAATASQHMTELYGLYKQATEGDVNMKGDEVSADDATKASGPAGLSQAQWESWSKCKGMSEDEAKRQYVARAADIEGGGGVKNGRQEEPAAENTTTSRQPDQGPGLSAGGLRGDITAGAPYGGEDKLKGEQ